MFILMEKSQKNYENFGEISMKIRWKSAEKHRGGKKRSRRACDQGGRRARWWEFSHNFLINFPENSQKFQRKSRRQEERHLPEKKRESKKKKEEEFKRLWPMKNNCKRKLLSSVLPSSRSEKFAFLRHISQICDYLEQIFELFLDSWWVEEKILQKKGSVRDRTLNPCREKKLEQERMEEEKKEQARLAEIARQEAQLAAIVAQQKLDQEAELARWIFMSNFLTWLFCTENFTFS